ncbi:MAG: beta-galactosidase [Clostridia bacterium]|nr:beta-galactosidase [Clostridia bacterium]NCC42808.1 beta-galactosidase [Clostridia bacterium]
MGQIVNGEDLVLGTCYYPEHWPESMWEEDLKRMLENGIQVIRIAEFAWSKIEPVEGTFTYEFFDGFLDLAKNVGMKVIFCTPTATPPAWLTQKYPEVLNANIDGVLYRHGARRHYNYNSPVYLEKTRIIVEKSALHYAQHPAIIGWQIDNELNCEKDVFYSESDSVAFRDFLKDKYGDLDTLNNAWGTVFWNQTYTNWSEIYVPRTTYSDSTNPHEILDYTRFISCSARAYAKLQSDILRKYIKTGDFITTNGLFGNLDNHQMTRESLDFLTYDSYPNFAYTKEQYDKFSRVLQDRMWSRNLMEIRSASPCFGIMEQQSGANGWNTGMGAPTPKPGQMTLWTMQSVAHGADYISYFRWRTCTMGTEIYWHGILDYSGRDNRRLKEVADINKKFKKLQKIAGAKYQAQVAVVKDYDNIWDARLDVWHGDVEAVSQQALFVAAQKTHTPLDYVYLDDEKSSVPLKDYKVLFYPHPSLITPERVKILEEYVAQGGILVLGCRSGYKDMTGKCVMDKLPGHFGELTGTDIPEYTRTCPGERPVTIRWGDHHLEAPEFNDQLMIREGCGKKASVLGKYEDCYYEGAAGLILNKYGKGQVYYFGAAFTEKTVKVFLEELGVKNPYRKVIELPKCCELAVRKKDGKEYFFVLNYSGENVKIHVKDTMKDMYTQKVTVQYPISQK